MNLRNIVISYKDNIIRTKRQTTVLAFVVFDGKLGILDIVSGKDSQVYYLYEVTPKMLQKYQKAGNLQYLAPSKSQIIKVVDQFDGRVNSQFKHILSSKNIYYFNGKYISEEEKVAIKAGLARLLEQYSKLNDNNLKLEKI